MVRSWCFAALAGLVLVGGCASTETSSTAPKSSPSATLPWDERQLDGDLVEVRAVGCTGRDCPLGVISLTLVVEVSDGVAAGSRADTRVAITDDTVLLGCGPTDGRERISFDDLLRSRRTEVIGEMPTSVWIADAANSETGGDDAPFPLRASQVVSGSCG